MNATRYVPIIAALVLLLPAAAHAQPFTLVWNTFDNGGATPRVAGTFEMRDTLGQPDAAPTLAAGTFTLTGGFWAVEAVACRADFNGDGSLTLADFVAFRNAYVANDPAADFDGSGTLTLADFVAFRNEYVAGCP